MRRGHIIDTDPFGGDPYLPIQDTVDILDLVDEPEPHYNWVIPDAMARRDRLIITGDEGYGKSTLLRQIGVQVAAGVHPFTLETIEPAKVVLLDVENSREQIRNESRRLVEAAGKRLKAGNFTYITRPEGLDFQLLPDIDWLRRKLDAIQPDLLIAGPHYKLGNGDPASEEVGKRVITAIDSIRVEYDVAFILEAHCPHAQSGIERTKRPYGWSGWVRWPEFGKHIAKDGTFSKWRGDRAQRSWPRGFERAQEWPWMVQGMESYMELWTAIVEECQKAGDALSERELALRLDASKTAIHRAKTAHNAEWSKLSF